MSVGGLEGCFVFEITRTCEEENRNGLQESNLPSYHLCPGNEAQVIRPSSKLPSLLPTVRVGFLPSLNLYIKVLNREICFTPQLKPNVCLSGVARVVWEFLSEGDMSFPEGFGI